MSLEVWLASGQKVKIGGKEFMLTPLPLRHLVALGKWLEENCNDVVKGVIAQAKASTEMNPFGMVTEILLRVNLNDIIFMLLSKPKDPDTGEPINKITKEFVDDYLDTVSARSFIQAFITVNDLEELIKNLRRLPIIEKLMDAAMSTFGLPYLNSLQPNTDLTQSTSEGSPSLKSTATSAEGTTEKPDSGMSSSL